jgi:hypothetical protein
VGVYVSVRGWVDCSDGQETLIQEIVDRYDDGFYSRGWSIVRGPNETACVFYYGTVHEQAVEWLLDQVRNVASLPPPIDVEDRVRGLFFAHHELNGMQEWQVRDGQLFIEPAGDRYDYLYA